MDFVIHRHGEIALAFGLAALAVWWLARRRAADPVVRRSLTVLCVLLALQGVVGLDQYETHLPTELVWVHVGLACGAWLAALWAACAAGRLAPRGARIAADRRGRAPESPGARQVPRKLGLFWAYIPRLRASSSSPAVSLLEATTLEKGVV